MVLSGTVTDSVDEVVDFVSELIRFDTSNTGELETTKGEAECARWVADRLEDVDRAGVAEFGLAEAAGEQRQGRHVAPDHETDQKRKDAEKAQKERDKLAAEQIARENLELFKPGRSSRNAKR